MAAKRNSDKYLNRFNSVLAKVEENGIQSSKDFTSSRFQNLYCEFWLACEAFINHVALCSKNHLNKKTQKYEKGNREKVEELLLDGADLEDIQHDILVKIISKLDLILARPASQMVGYCYSIVNTALIDIYRAYHPEDVAGFVSLYEPVKGTSVDQDDVSEIINFIADENTPEDEVIARENVSAIICARRQTQKEELLKKRKEILQEVDILSEKPDEALARLYCVHLKDKALGNGKLDHKPGDLTIDLMQYGEVTVFSRVLAEIHKRYNIDPQVIQGKLNGAPSQKKLKLDTMDKKKISDQVSKLVWRAEDRIKKSKLL